MILVFLLLVLMLLIIVTFAHIKFNLKRLKITNIPKYQYCFDFNFELYLFNKIKIAKFNLNESKIKESRVVRKIADKIKLMPESMNLKKTNLLIKRLNLRLEEFNLKLLIGTEDASFTAILSTIISSAIGIILR